MKARPVGSPVSGPPAAPRSRARRLASPPPARGRRPAPAAAPRPGAPPRSALAGAWRVGVLASLLLLAAALLASAGQEGSAADRDRDARLAWFHQAKFGLFIHWGLYAVPAGEWKGEFVPGIGEWIMYRKRIPVSEYEGLAKQFNPVRYDADAWAQLAVDAGMKYVVITSKHHDGFALFDSDVSDFDMVDATPYGRDVLKPLADACARHGLRLGFYYSQAQDWHEPNGAGNTWDFGPDEEKDFDAYLRGKAEPQLRELLTGYGPVALIWFDTPRLMNEERARRFTEIVRELQPETLIDGRLGMAGDYVTTGDNVIPDQVPEGAWETPATINHTWGFKKQDHDWKSPGEIVFKLVDIVSKGGNYLLNVGPRADGTIPEASQVALREVGRWLKTNGEAVYDAGPTPFGEDLGEPSSRGTRDVRGRELFLPYTEWRVTTRPGKLYFTFFEEPRVPFPLPAMKNAVVRAHRLADGHPIAVEERGGERLLRIDRPSGGATAAMPDPDEVPVLFLDPMGTVVVVEIEGEAVVR